MAATALALAVPLVTHNPRDYEGVDGLTVISMARQKYRSFLMSRIALVQECREK
jgi:hypothetical protein